MTCVDIESGAYTVYEDGTVTSHRKPTVGVQKWIVDSAYSRVLSRRPFGHYYHYKLMLGGKKKLIQTHRLIWQSFNGPIPPGMIVRHLDDNPANNALSNLVLGTHKDNAKDAARNGVLRTGEKHGMHKLTADAVRSIRERAAAGESETALAMEHGVWQGTISAVLCGQRWKSVGGPIRPPRERHGERSALAVLTAAQVDDVRATPRAVVNDREMAARLGVSRSTISNIRSGKGWVGTSRQKPPHKEPKCTVRSPDVRMQINLRNSLPAPCSTRLNLLGGSFPLEEWRDVPGWSGYMASSLGRVRSHKRVVRHVLAPRAHGPYLSLVLSESRENHHRRTIHRIVCETFHGPAPHGLVARHLNGNPHDNRAANLAWGTPRENVRDMFRHGHGQQNESHWNARLTDEQVEALRADFNTGMGRAALAAKYGISSGHTYDITTGRRRRLPVDDLGAADAV